MKKPGLDLPNRADELAIKMTGDELQLPARKVGKLITPVKLKTNRGCNGVHYYASKFSRLAQIEENSPRRTQRGRAATKKEKTD
jgi:hypothetical protein